MTVPLGVWVAAGASVVMFAGSLVIAYFTLVRMPVDFLNDSPRVRPTRSLWAGVPLFVIRNLTGLAMLLSGVIMLFTPGQGVLFIVLGLALLDIPGKHRVLQRLLANPRIYQMLNRIRARAGKPPLEPVKARSERESASC